MPPNKDNLREEFEEWFGKTRNLAAGVGFPASTIQISDWWLAKFQAREDELLAKYENCPQCVGLRDVYKDELIQEIEGEKLIALMGGKDVVTHSRLLGYNDGLLEAIAIIKSNKLK